MGSVRAARGRLARLVAAGVLVGAASLAAVLTAAPAQAGGTAGTVEVGIDGNLHFEAAPGVANHLVVSSVGTTVDIDDVVPIIPIGACEHPIPPDETLVRCTVAPASPDLEFETGDLADSITCSGDQKWLVNLGSGNDTSYPFTDPDSATTIVGGDGNDTFISGESHEWFRGNAGVDTVSYAERDSTVVVDLEDGEGGDGGDEDTYDTVENVIGGSANDTLIGDGMANTLTGGDGNDLLYGHANNDTLIGGLGDDGIYGGSGSDMVSYATHEEGVSVYLDNAVTNGAPGEDDYLSSMESITGSSYDDLLWGTDSPNSIYGDPYSIFSLPLWGGDDSIYGNGGGDALSGGGGDDVVWGGEGDDDIGGGFGADILWGGSGADEVNGGAGADRLHGGNDFDALNGGADTDYCYTELGGGTKTSCELPLVWVP